MQLPIMNDALHTKLDATVKAVQRKLMFRTMSSINDFKAVQGYQRGAKPHACAEMPSRPRITKRKSIIQPIADSDALAQHVPEPIVQGRSRSNTTSTIYAPKGTMSRPDLHVTVENCSTVLRAHLIRASESPLLIVHSDYLIFNDPSLVSGIPALAEITTFIQNVYIKAQMESECIIMTLIYIERLLKATSGDLQLQPCNWKSIVFISMVLASKIWDDMSMWNGDFAKVCPSFSPKRVNQLEIAYVTAVQFKVNVNASSYAKYYFHLRSMDTKDNANATPINVKRAMQIHFLSETLPVQTKAIARRRSPTLCGTANETLSRSESGNYTNITKVNYPASIEQLVPMHQRIAGSA